MIATILGALFGGRRNVIAETAGVFRENTEAGAQRRAQYAQAALSQYAAEFSHERRGLFDRLIDGLNRLPRPLMALSTFALLGSAMFDPLWFAERMQGLTLVPEPLWWLMGTIVAFYFGGRFQAKSQDFKKSAAQTAALVPKVMENISQLRALRHDSPGVADTGSDAALSMTAVQGSELSDNAAVRAWQENAQGQGKAKPN